MLVVAAALLSSQAAFADFFQRKLVGTGAIGQPRQGHSVAISGDGSTVVVGGFGDNLFAGAAWLYRRDNTGVWVQKAKLVGTGALGVERAMQGISVGLSSDGNTVIVGGERDANRIGAAWVFKLTGGVWIQQAKLVGMNAIGTSFQGASVALSSDGNTAIVGGPHDSDLRGAAWVYKRSGDGWIQQAKLIGSNAIGKARLGVSVALSSSGNTAIVGGSWDGEGHGPRNGAAWVFVRSGNTWIERAKLVGLGPIHSPMMGTSVALSADGNTAIAGGFIDNLGVGAAWVFVRSGTTWNQQDKLIGTGAMPKAAQGQSVALSADGNTAIVGGNFDADHSGAVWVFKRVGGAWRQQQKVVGLGGVGAPQLGYSVGLSSDGRTAIVGGPIDNNFLGAAWLFAAPRPRPEVGAPADRLEQVDAAGQPLPPSSASSCLWAGRTFSPGAKFCIAPTKTTTCDNGRWVVSDFSPCNSASPIDAK